MMVLKRVMTVEILCSGFKILRGIPLQQKPGEAHDGSWSLLIMHDSRGCERMN